MKKTIFVFFIVLIFSFGACNDPVFFDISQEVEPIDPKIMGGPTNFVLYNDKMYVASGLELWEYTPAVIQNTKGAWRSIQNQKRIVQLAVADNLLYALCEEDASVEKVLMSYNGTNWHEKIVPYFNIDIHAIYAANDELFIGNKLRESDGENNFSILNTSFVTITNTGNNLLNGAAYANGIYYLIVRDMEANNRGGIFTTTSPSSPGSISFIQNSNYTFMGIISLNDNGNTVVAITRNGRLFKVEASGLGNQPIATFDSRMATGALAVWTNPVAVEHPRNLLLAGLQDEMTNNTNFIYGYRELIFDPEAGIASSASFNEPGKSQPSSVSNNARYLSTIGKQPVNHIFQAPAPDYTVFASTQKNGVWSYRERRDGWQWNAEE